MLAVAMIVKRTISDARLVCAMSAMADPAADPDFVTWVRRYYVHDYV
jgi:hypothetical protein